jgi:hypothetical protein
MSYEMCRSRRGFQKGGSHVSTTVNWAKSADLWAGTKVIVIGFGEAVFAI